MITKDQTAATAMPWVGLLLLALGLGVGWMVRGASTPSGGATPGSPLGGGEPPPVLGGPFAADAGVTSPAADELTELRLTVAEEHAAILQRARDRALAQGVIERSDAEVVPAEVRIGDRTARAEVRLKGDWTDHVDTDKWSLRVELQDDKLLGMSRFSIQQPKTRGFLMEWLMMAIARSEGLLAPRSTFVQVVVNDRPSGVYYLEEHFTKELLESQGRRDGPIVRFQEDTLWTTWLQYGFPKQAVPKPVAFAATEHAAGVEAYNEKRLASVRDLNLRLQRAVQLMRELQLQGLAASSQERLAALDALVSLQGRTVEELFVADKLGRMLALYSLVPADHGLSWHALRFYHDPVLDRLEPVMFDTGARLELPQRDLAALVPHLAELARSDHAYEAMFRTLGRFARPGYVPQLMRAVGPELHRFEAALRAERILPPDHGVDAIAARLRSSSDRIRAIVLPRDPANFACWLIDAEEGAGSGAAMIEVEAWATTIVPVVVEGFRFGNGRVVPAARTLTPEHDRYRRSDEHIVLPRPGRHLRLRFPADPRLLGLRDVQDVVRAAREQTERDRNVKVRLDAIFASIAAETMTQERLPLRRVEAVSDLGEGRPAAPTLRDALERHECLGYSIELDRLVLRAGTWNIDGDLIIPQGHVLSAGPGVTLRFAAGAVFLTDSPLQLTGIETRPVVLEAQDPATGWGGLVVVDAPRRSALSHVVIRHAGEIRRGGWQTTGGVTFYRSPVDLAGVRIEDARGEDALNIFGTDFNMLQTTLQGGVSDLLDADFVTGTVRDCTFRESAADGVDFSGSRATIEGCTFAAIGDKALSIGEQSTVTLRHNTVHQAAIAVAAKDSSDVTIESLRVDRAEHYALAVYIKKPEFGPSRMTARDVEVGAAGRGKYLAQEGCSLEVDGETIPGTELDVKFMYEQGILGK